MKRKHFAVRSICAAVALALGGSPQAQLNEWQGVDDDWSTGSNWTAGVPVDNQDVVVGDALGGVTTVQYNETGNPNYKTLLIEGVTVVHNDTGGLQVSETMTVGADGFSIYDLSVAQQLGIGSGGKLVVGANAGSAGYIAQHNADSVVQVGSDGGDLILGEAAGAYGEYILTNGTLNVAGTLVVGDAGEGLFSQADGIVNAGILVLGRAAGGLGTYQFDGGTLNDQLIVGDAGTGTFNNNGGAHTVTNELFLGNQATGDGTYNLSNGGSLTVTDPTTTGRMIVGNEGKGTFNHVSGTVETFDLFLGYKAGGVGAYTIDDGQLTAHGTLYLGADEFGNVQGQGTFVQNGGAVNLGALNTNGGYGAPTSSYTLNDGTLVSGSFGSMSNDSVFDHNGGTHTNNGLFIIGNSGGSDYDTVYNITGAAAVANFNDLIVGGFGRGVLNQSDGAVNVSGLLRIGDGPNLDPSKRYGQYNISGGALIAQNNVIVGVGNNFFAGQPGGFGTVNQTGGTVSIGGDLVLGQAGSIGGGLGYYNMDGGSLSVDGTLRVGDLGNAAAGVGEFTLNAGDVGAYHLIVDSGSYKQIGGTVTVTDNLVVGDVGGSNGQYLLSFLGTVSAHDLHIGESLGATGSFSQTGGATVTIGSLATTEGEMFVGRYGSGTYALSGGFLTVGATEWIGVEGVGVFEQSGGNNKTTDLVLGVRNAGDGRYEMSGGNLDVLNNMTVGGGSNTIGETGGTGTFIQSGGPVNVVGAVFVGGAGAVAGGNGSYTISGGTLTTDALVVAQTNAVGRFFQSAGGVTVTGFLTVGEGSASDGQYNLSGGTLNAGNTIIGGALLAEPSGALGVFNQSGGTFETGYLNIGGGGFTLKGDGFYTLSGGSLVVGDSLNVGNDVGGTGSFDQTAGSVQVNGAGATSGLYVNNGTYKISGTVSTLDVVNDLIVGGVGGALSGVAGHFQQSGTTTVTVGRDLRIAAVDGSEGSYNLSGTTSSLTVTGMTVVGDLGLGTFTQSGGTHTTGQLVVGAQLGSSGTYNLLGGTLKDDAIVGDAGTGFVFNSGGLHDVTGNVILGNQATGQGTYNLSLTGALTVSNNIIVGNQGTGNLSITNDATLSATNRLTIGGSNNGTALQSGNSVVTVGGLRVGEGVGSTASTYTMNGGTLNVLSTEGVNGGSRIGLAGTGTFTQNGGTHNTTFMQIGGATFGQGGGGTGVYNLNGGVLAASGNIEIGAALAPSGSGTLNVAGGALTAGAIINKDKLNYSAGSITANVNNNAGGTFAVSGGAARTLTGDLTNSGTTTVAASTPFKVTGTLTQNSGASIVANSSITVGTDYVNGGWGSGNSFNRHANITLNNGAQIIGENAHQTITATGNPGALANNGPNEFTLDLGTVRGGGGQVTLNYQVKNDGTGASIRGAIQTAANGGNITDGRLSGSGVGATNLNAIAAGGNSGNLSVTFTGSSGGALTGQKVAIYSNFDNVATQIVNLTGGVTILANGNATPSPGPVDLGNFRVGGTMPTQQFAVENTVSGSLAERLGIATPVSTTGNFSASSNLGGGFINPGTSQANALTASVLNGAAGVNNGSMTVQYTTNGQLINASFGTVNANQQSIDLTATGYVAAAGQIQTPTLNFGNVQVGQAVSQGLVIRNTATGPAGYVEDLNASFGTSTDVRISGSGTLAGILAGTNSTAGNGAMTVNVDTGSAGNVNGSIQVLYQTAGKVNGVSNGLGTASVGSEDYGVIGAILQGNVIDQAKPVINGIANPGAVTVDLGNVRINGVAGQTLTVLNQATGNQQANLNAAVASNGAPVTASGSFTGLAPGTTNNTSLQVGVNTSVAGFRSGSATVSLVSDITSFGNCSPNCTLNLPSQTVNVSANVFQVAQPDVPANVNLGNFRLGSAPSQAITIGNTDISPAGFQEGLDAAIGGTGGKASASGGPISNLAAGGTSNAITVGINNATATAGANAGTVTLNLASNGTGTSGLATLALADAVINVSGTGWNMANGQATPSPVNLGNFRVGQAGGAAPQSQDIAVSNTVAGPFTEGLGIGTASISNAAFALTNNLGANLVAAGGSNATALNVARAGGVAGLNTGTLSIQYTTDGTGTSGLAAINANSQDITVNATGYLVAQPNVPVNVNLGNVRVGSASQALTITNTNVAGSFQEGLNASTGALGGQGTASGGPITNLAPGGSSNAISVGLSGITAGTGNAGTVQINLASNGTASGLSDLTLASQTVNVSATGYRLANPQINNPLPITLAARVGDAVSANTGVSISNVSPDIYTEGLKVQVTGASGNVQHNSGAISNLAAQGTDSTSILVGLASTATAGTTASQVGLKYISTGAGTTGAPDQDIGTGTVTVNSKVYTAAVGTLDPSQSTSLNFGTVRVGTAIGATLQNVTVKNAAAVTALNDTLTATLTTGDAPFQAFSTVSGIQAGQTNAPGTLKLGMNTGTAGNFSGSAQVAYKSVNPDMADLDLSPSSLISMQGTVNALANPVFGKTGGAGSFGCVGLVCTLDFGTLFVGSGGISGTLALANDVADPADDLLGDFNLSSLGDFIGSGFGPVDLAAGDSFGPLQISFDALTEGMFSGSFLFSGFSHNAFQSDLALNDITILLRANVVRRGTVPEPGTIAIVLLAGGLALLTARRRRQAQ